MAKRFSGRFVLRLPPALHGSLSRRSAEQGVSLNELCVSTLKASAPDQKQALLEVATGGTCLDALTAHDCLATFGDRLEAIALFGSVVRGDATSESDADLLIVLRHHEALDRDLYRQWDELPCATARIAGHPVSPQFVVLPEDGQVPGGIWYEVAVDGLVWWDRAGRLARMLRRLRKDMAAGSVQRKHTHGHPYWVRRRTHA